MRRMAIYSMGLIAIVAVYKNVGFQERAKTKAIQAAIAEGIYQVNTYGAKHILNHGKKAENLKDLIAEGLDRVYAEGDFIITYSQVKGKRKILISAEGKEGTFVSGAKASKEIGLTY